MNILSSKPLLLNAGLLIARVITGVLMIYHGYDIFDANKMNMYGKWLGEIRFPEPMLQAYLGKGSELVGSGDSDLLQAKKSMADRNTKHLFIKQFTV